MKSLTIIITTMSVFLLYMLYMHIFGISQFDGSPRSQSTNCKGKCKSNEKHKPHALDRGKGTIKMKFQSLSKVCMLQASPKNAIPYDIWTNFVQNNPWHKQPIRWRVKIWSTLQSSIWLYPGSYCSHHVTTKLSDSHEIPWTRRTWSLNMLYMTCFRDFTSLPTPYQHPFIVVINTLLSLSSYIVHHNIVYQHFDTITFVCVLYI